MNPKLTHFKTVSEWAAADYYRAQKWCPGKTWKELREIFHSDYEGEDGFFSLKIKFTFTFHADEDIQFTGEVRKELPMGEEDEIEEVGPSTSTAHQQERQPSSSSSLKHKLPRRRVTNEEEDEENDAILEEQPTSSTQAQKQMLPMPDLVTLDDEDEAVDADDEDEVISLGQPSTSQSTSGRVSRFTRSNRPADDLDGDEVNLKIEINPNFLPD